jgi:hypothetical protein
MKKITFILLMTFCATILFAQWEPINTGLDDYPPKSLWPLGDDMALGTWGGGIYVTNDNGNNWSNVNGNLGDLNVHDIRGFNSNTSLFVATQGGPFITFDLADYTDCTSTGLSNSDAKYFWWGDEDLGGSFMVGTNGGGVFASEDFTGPWVPANTNLTGDALIINDLGGYSEGDQSYVMVATENGTYLAINGATEWSEVNSGLSGDALKVKKIGGLGFLVLIATHGGLYYNLDLADNWLPLIPNEKLNTVLFVVSPLLPTGFACMAFGENAFYSEDIFNWIPLDMTGIEGEITAANVNSTHLFIGVTADSKSGGAVYRRPLDQLTVGIEEHSINKQAANLFQNHPNPFNGSTEISYSLSDAGFVSLKVYDMFGREVRSLVNDFRARGEYQVEFNVSGLSEGIYFYILDAGRNNRITKKMMIAK